jgi:hypothetical protein
MRTEPRDAVVRSESILARAHTANVVKRLGDWLSSEDSRNQHA